MKIELVRGPLLGKGSYGKVFLGISSNCLFAIKSSLLECSSSLAKEQRILNQFFGCPEVIQCYGSNFSFKEGMELYNLILEYAVNGTLLGLIVSYGGLIPESDVKKYTGMLLKGLSFIHNRGFVHCDLKPENILVGEFYELKIADFGLAVEPGEDADPWKWTFRFRGTPNYMSPESVAWGELKAPLDIWSLGCIVLQMLRGKPPWRLNSKELMIELVFGCDTPIIPVNLSEKCKDFLKKCLARDPRERWTADMLLKHPFVLENSHPIVRLEHPFVNRP